jgi:energy-converting hydrogenase Eha subunit H
MALGALGGWEPLLYLVLFSLVLGLDIAAVRNIMQREGLSRKRKWGWVTLVVFLPLLGAMAYILNLQFQKNG